MWDSILNGCAWLLSQLAHAVGDWGIAIIIVTFVIRLCLFPLQRKQFKSSYEMQKFQPRLQEIQTLYEGDQQRIQEETMKLYRETGFNPMAGCLPMIIQMPIFIILFQVLRWKIGDFWTEDLGVTLLNIIPNLTQTLPDAMGVGFQYCIVYLVLAILFVIFSCAPMIYQLISNKNAANPNQTLLMTGVMGIMFLWMAWISPAGVMLYWAISSCFGFVQQVIQQRLMKKQDAEEEERLAPTQPVKVNVERREKKKRPTKQSKKK